MQSEIEQRSAKVLGSLVFGIIAIFVELKYFNIDLNFLDSSIDARRSHPINSQQLWKNKVLKPSGPRALFGGKENTTSQIFWMIKGAKSLEFSMGDIILAICWIKSSTCEGKGEEWSSSARRLWKNLTLSSLICRALVRKLPTSASKIQKIDLAAYFCWA